MQREIMLSEGITLAANRLRTALGDTPQDSRATLGQLLQLVERVTQRLNSARSQPSPMVAAVDSATPDSTGSQSRHCLQSRHPMPEPELITKANRLAHASFGTTFTQRAPGTWRTGELTAGGAVMLRDVLSRAQIPATLLEVNRQLTYVLELYPEAA